VVDEPAFEHVYQLVVAAWISRQYEESRIDEIANRVQNDSFHYFAVEELKPHPDSVNDWRTRVKIQMITRRIAIKAIDIENSLDVFDGNVFDLVGIEPANAKAFRSVLGSVAEQVFDGVPSRGFKVALDGSRSELDHDLFRLGWNHSDHERKNFLERPRHVLRRDVLIYLYDPE
jgi:hypothetical protein